MRRVRAHRNVLKLPTRLLLRGEKISVLTCSILCTFGRVFCRHRRIIFRRNPAGIMGHECFRCGAWWPLEAQRSELARKLDRNAGQVIPRQELKTLERSNELHGQHPNG